MDEGASQLPPPMNSAPPMMNQTPQSQSQTGPLPPSGASGSSLPQLQQQGPQLSSQQQQSQIPSPQQQQPQHHPNMAIQHHQGPPPHQMGYPPQMSHPAPHPGYGPLGGPQQIGGPPPQQPWQSGSGPIPHSRLNMPPLGGKPGSQQPQPPIQPGQTPPHGNYTTPPPSAPQQQQAPPAGPHVLPNNYVASTLPPSPYHAQLPPQHVIQSQGPIPNGGSEYAPQLSQQPQHYSQQQQQSITGGIPNPECKMNMMQQNQLRAQIMAYRCISRGQALPENIMLAYQGKRPFQYPTPPPTLPPQQQISSQQHPSTIGAHHQQQPQQQGLQPPHGWRPQPSTTPDAAQQPFSQRSQTPGSGNIHQGHPQAHSPSLGPNQQGPPNTVAPPSSSSMVAQFPMNNGNVGGPQVLPPGHGSGPVTSQSQLPLKSIPTQLNGGTGACPPPHHSDHHPPGPVQNGVPHGPPIPQQHQHHHPPVISPYQQHQQIQAFQSMTNQLNAATKPARVTPMTKPEGLDPIEMRKERDNYIAQRIAHRIEELSTLPANLPEDLRLKAMVEYRALRLLNFQKQLRADVIACMRRDSTLETGQNPKLYRRPKRIGLREARITEKLEKQQKLEQERRRKQKHQEYISAILQHAKEFKEYHRNIQLKIGRINKAVAVYHANTEREQKKEQERIEKLRMKRLMEEDEEGYRKLIDQKKDKRLAFLLSQTDEYIKNLTEMVRQHKEEQKKKMKERKKVRRKKKKPVGEDGSQPDGAIDDSSQQELRVNVIETETGKMLTKEEAPLASELDAWLSAHPTWSVAPKETGGSASIGDKDDESESEYEDVTESETDDEADLSSKTETKQNVEPKPSSSVLESGDETVAATAASSTKPTISTEDDEYKASAGDDQVNYYNIAHGIHERITEQSSLLKNGKLKEYQLKGLEWLVSLYNNNLNGILADEMGLGKTIQTIALITYLIEKKKNNGPYLIIVPLSTMSNWMMEFERWAPTVVKIAYKGII